MRADATKTSRICGKTAQIAERYACIKSGLLAMNKLAAPLKLLAQFLASNLASRLIASSLLVMSMGYCACAVLLECLKHR